MSAFDPTPVAHPHIRELRHSAKGGAARESTNVGFCGAGQECVPDNQTGLSQVSIDKVF
jgi:hypothetical protein